MRRLYLTIIVLLLAAPAGVAAKRYVGIFGAERGGDLFAAYGATRYGAGFAAADGAAPDNALPSAVSPNEARRHRGFSTSQTFVPKGQWIFGGSASYSTHDNETYKFLIIEDISSTGYTVKVSPMIAYSPKDNMAVGARFIYGRSMLGIDNAGLKFGDEESGVNIKVDYYHQVRQDYSGALFWRQYIPMGRSNRFAIITEIQLCFSGGQSALVAEDGVLDGFQKYRGTYATHFGTSVGLQPGIVAFATNNMAFEISIGVFGISYDHTKQTHNRVEVGEVKTSMMNFKVNLLSIGFGVSFYL